LTSDEILFNARIHPEQYSNTLSAAQVSQLHKSLHYVVSHAVDNLVEWDSFPKSWLFKHRWDKGKKNSPSQLANGAKIEFITVGGRTSAVVPSVQKKTGPVAGDVKHESDGDENPDVKSIEGNVESKKSKGKGGKGEKKTTSKPASTKEPETVPPTTSTTRKKVAQRVKNDEPVDSPQQETVTNPSRFKKRATNPSSIDEDPNARTTPTNKAAPANKKRALNSETPDKLAGGRGGKKSKVEASTDDRPIRRSARVRGAGLNE
jgi:hypothetical protein